ncbi:MAG: DUF692 domain-containing protein [Acidimicrobiia bacterium]
MTLPDLPYLGAGLSYQHRRHADYLEHRDSIDFLELPTDVLVRHLDAWRDDVLEISRRFPTVAHGIHMGLGDARGVRRDYLDRARRCFELFDPVWCSDHLDMSNFAPDEEMLAHGVVVPFTRDQAQVFTRNIATASELLGRPLIVENLFYDFVVPMASSLPEPGFIAAALAGTEAGLLLDVTNLHINARNLGFDPYQWLEAAPLERVVEIHVAGSERRRTGALEGRWYDSHSRPVPDEDWELVEYVARHSDVDVKALVVERDRNDPPMAELLDELAVGRSLLERSRQPVPMS